MSPLKNDRRPPRQSASIAGLLQAQDADRTYQDDDEFDDVWRQLSRHGMVLRGHVVA